MMKRTRPSTQQVSGVGRPARRARLVLPVLGLLLIGLASSAVAQDATFTGKVFDPKMKPVEGAAVSLTKTDDPNVKATAVTDKKGEYKLTIGTAGDYKLRAEKEGFGPGERPAKAELGMLYADADLQLGDAAVLQQNQAVEAFNAGVKDLQAGKPEAAIENFKKASELNPKLPQPVYAMAAAYHGLKKWPEAAAALDKYQQMAPTDVRPELYQLAFETYFEAGQDDKAKAALAKITDPKAKAELAPRVYNSGVAKNKEGDVPGSVERFKLAGRARSQLRAGAPEHRRDRVQQAELQGSARLHRQAAQGQAGLGRRAAHAVLLAARPGRRAHEERAAGLRHQGAQRRRGGRQDRG